MDEIKYYMTNDLIILNFLKAKGIGCKTDLIPLLKDLYPKASNGSIEQLTDVAPTINHLIETLEREKLLQTYPSNFGTIGWKIASNYLYLDNVSLSASIRSEGIQYLNSLSPISHQTINLSGNGNNVNQSFFDNSRSKRIKQNANPNENPKQKNAVISFIEKFWGAFAIPILVGIILIIIDFNFFKN